MRLYIALNYVCNRTKRSAAERVSPVAQRSLGVAQRRSLVVLSPWRFVVFFVLTTKRSL